MKDNVKNNPFIKKPATLMTIKPIPEILFHFQEVNPKMIANADNQNTDAPLDAIASSLKREPAAVTKRPHANPVTPPKMDKTAIHAFIK